MPDQESWNVALRISQNGRPHLTMSAAYMARYDNPDTTYAILGPDPESDDSTRVRIELFDENGSPSLYVFAARVTFFDSQNRFEGEGGVEAVIIRAGNARLTAARIVFDEADGRFTASGNVAVATDDGKRLSAEEVVWDEGRRQLRVPGSFQFITASERISGVGLVASEDLSQYSFSRASGELEVEE